ncbi:FadR/GntR family transcriptional regulator [Aestuariivirga sp.]|uniref:FadR/GntR family transcriptional regulator n=1 Tax=Aestuariivirga sp. TaxID=2650926 RepID=UPI003BAB0CF0
MRTRTEPSGSARLTAETDSDLLALLERIAGTGPLDVQAVRLMVEPYAAQSAASNATAADLEAIRNTHLAVSDAVEMELFERLDAEFHRQIFAATRNDLLSCVHDVLKIIRGQSAWIDIKRRSFSETRRREYAAQHGLIVNALFERNASAAAESMRAHLRTVSHNLFGDEGETIQLSKRSS